MLHKVFAGLSAFLVVVALAGPAFAQTPAQAWHGSWYFPIQGAPGVCNSWLHHLYQVQGDEIGVLEVWDSTVGIHTAGEWRNLTRLKILGDRNAKALAPYQDVAWSITLLTCWLSPDLKEVNCETLHEYPGEPSRRGSMTFVRKEKCSSFRPPFGR